MCGKNEQLKRKIFHPQIFLPNSSLEQIYSQEWKIPSLVSQWHPFVLNKAER